MSEIRVIADRFDAILADMGMEKYTYTLVQSEKHELNVEGGEFKLLRTVFNNWCKISVFRGAKKGTADCNDNSEEGLRKLAGDALAAAESAEEDPCHDFAPDQGKHVFRQGVYEPDIDRFLSRMKELLATIAEEYPKIRILSAVASYDRDHWISRTTNNTEFEGFKGKYDVYLEISATDGESTTGLDYFEFVAKDLDTPFIEMADMRRHLQNTVNSLNPVAAEGKFTGTLLLTPDCVATFISMLSQNYMGSDVIIDGTSQWLDKVGEQVMDDRITVSLKPYDERIVSGERGTQDGFLSEDVTVIDHGVLKMHMLNLYAANKTGRPMMQNTGNDMVVEPGDKTVDELLASIEHGLLMGGFSGGSPGVNGEFSGVAKNSFFIENGKITGPATETMVNGNLADIFRNVRGISKELQCDGFSVIPFIAVDGVVISGK
ncbi:MAG: TldD/PmbA family protein [Lachnospiraceae bacterium]|nr:TldD/PmbA family protein [Lachnospiraceae bacterium]